MISLMDAQNVAPLLEMGAIASIEEIQKRIDLENKSFDYIYNLILSGELRSIDLIAYVLDGCSRSDVLERIVSGPFELAIDRLGSGALDKFNGYAKTNKYIRELLSGKGNC